MSLQKRLASIIHSKHMLKGIALASFLESTVVPIPLETIMVPLMQKRRDMIWMIALVVTLACLAGATLGYVVGYYLFEWLESLIMTYIATPEQFATFENKMREGGFWLIFSAGVTPVPLQLAMLSAGVTAYSFGLFIFATALGRVIRYFGLALLVHYFGNQTEKLIMQYKWQAGALSLCALALLVWYWLA